MKVNGICKDCAYRWQVGSKNGKQHLWCIEKSCIVKNPNMQGCSFYKPASLGQIKSMRKRGCGGISIKRKGENRKCRSNRLERSYQRYA